MKLPHPSFGILRDKVGVAGRATGILPSDCHATSYYRCTGAPEAPWADAYGNGVTCLAAKQNATMAYNQLCSNAGLGTAVFDNTSIACVCD